MATISESDPVERARRALEELERAEEKKYDWQKALVAQFWEHMTRYVK